VPQNPVTHEKYLVVFFEKLTAIEVLSITIMCRQIFFFKLTQIAVSKTAVVAFSPLRNKTHQIIFNIVIFLCIY